MKATVLDLRKNMKDVLAAIDRNEHVTLTYRGRKKAVIVPCSDTAETKSASDHPAFGIWADYADCVDVGAFVKKLRRGRF